MANRDSEHMFADRLKRSAILAFFLGSFFLSIPGNGQGGAPADAAALEKQGKLAEAAGGWRAVTRKNPGDASAFARLGVVLSEEQKYDEAAASYEKALELNPKLPGIRLNLGL